MQKWFATFFLWLCICGAASANIVFVHLGENVPSCIFTIIKQARALNPERPIYLLINNASYHLLHDREFLSQEQVLLINGDLLPKSKEHIEFKKLIQVDFSDSHAYLFYTLERFFYLFDLIEDHKLEDVVHLENDTMLYVDIEDLMPFFKKANTQLAAPFLSRAAAVPCFVFIKDGKSLLRYVDHVLDVSKHYEGPKPYIGVSDMKTLASFYRKFGDAYLTPLPTLMAEYGMHHLKRKSRFAPDNATTLDFFSKNGDLFPGFLFDAAALGIFANGNDRKDNPKSGPGQIHFRSLFNPQHFSFFWEKTSENRKAPQLKFKEQTYRIVNMHVHSKLPDDLTSY